MIHKTVDIDYWKALFPLADLPKHDKDWIGSESILGPRSLALIMFEWVQLGEDALVEGRDLMWGDCGTFYLFINSFGDLRWVAQGHSIFLVSTMRS